jgi:hypothetical protein
MEPLNDERRPPFAAYVVVLGMGSTRGSHPGPMRAALLSARAGASRVSKELGETHADCFSQRSVQPTYGHTQPAAPCGTRTAMSPPRGDGIYL